MKRALVMDGPLRGHVIDLPPGGVVVVEMSAPGSGGPPPGERVYRLVRWTPGYRPGGPEARMVLLLTLDGAEPDPLDVWDLLVSDKAKSAVERP